MVFAFGPVAVILLAPFSLGTVPSAYCVKLVIGKTKTGSFWNSGETWDTALHWLLRHFCWFLPRLNFCFVQLVPIKKHSTKYVSQLAMVVTVGGVNLSTCTRLRQQEQENGHTEAMGRHKLAKTWGATNNQEWPIEWGLGMANDSGCQQSRKMTGKGVKLCAADWAMVNSILFSHIRGQFPTENWAFGMEGNN